MQAGDYINLGIFGATLLAAIVACLYTKFTYKMLNTMNLQYIDMEPSFFLAPPLAVWAQHRTAAPVSWARRSSSAQNVVAAELSFSFCPKRRDCGSKIIKAKSGIDFAKFKSSKKFRDGWASLLATSIRRRSWPAAGIAIKLARKSASAGWGSKTTRPPSDSACSTRSSNASRPAASR